MGTNEKNHEELSGEQNASHDSAMTMQVHQLRDDHGDWRTAMASMKASATASADRSTPHLELSGDVALAAQHGAPGDLAASAHGKRFDPDKMHLPGWQMYRGEPLNIDLKPGIYRAQGNESFDAIARKQLGANATPELIEKYSNNLLLLNSKIGEDAIGVNKQEWFVKNGHSIVLPGYTKDGATLFRDGHNTQISIAPDGSETFRYSDGTQRHRVAAADGSYTDTVTGKRPGESFTVKMNSDGLLMSNDRVRPAEQIAKDLNHEREHLRESASQQLLLPKEHAEFVKNMQAFEQRAKEQHLSDKEVAQTYKDLSRILDFKGEHPLTSRERVRLAEGVMRNAAEPTSNDQGFHNTCQTTVLENRAYIREPSVVSGALADIAETGRFIGKEGTIVRMDPRNLRAHGDAGVNPEAGAGLRSYASQVLQTALIDAAYVRANELGIPPTDVRFVQSKMENSLGERVIDYNRIPPQQIADLPGFVGAPHGMVMMQQILTGRSEPDIIVSLKPGEKTQQSLTDGVVVSSRQELEQHFEKLKNANMLPAVIHVAANSDVLLPQRGFDKFKTLMSADEIVNDGHVMLLLDYDKKAHTAKVDGQWGNQNDFIKKPLTMDQVQTAMTEVSCLHWLERLDHNRSHLNDKQYSDQLSTIMTAYIKNWDARESARMTVDPKEVADSRARFIAMVSSLPPGVSERTKHTVQKEFDKWEANRRERNDAQTLGYIPNH